MVRLGHFKYSVKLEVHGVTKVFLISTIASTSDACEVVPERVWISSLEVMVGCR